MKKLKPLIVFSALWAISFLFILFIDLLHPSVSSRLEILKATLSGSLFLSQIIAILLTTALVYMVLSTKTSLRLWYSLSAAVIILAFVSILSYNYGPRIAGSDSENKIVYNCILGEVYRSAENNDALCVLKNLPIAASNSLEVFADSGSFRLSYGPQTIIFIFMELVLISVVYFVPFSRAKHTGT